MSPFCESVIERMRAGERLQWVGGEIDDGPPDERRFYLGRHLLTDDETHCIFAELVQSKIIGEAERFGDNDAVIRYEIK